MCIPRLLFFSLLVSVCITPVAAQSLPNKKPVSPQVVPMLPQNAEPSIRDNLFQRPLDLDALNLSPATPGGIRTRQYESNVIPSKKFRVLAPAQAQDDASCYSIRSYRVTRDDPRSDSTRLAGYSECQPATRFQVKAAVDSRETLPR